MLILSSPDSRIFNGASQTNSSGFDPLLLLLLLLLLLPTLFPSYAALHHPKPTVAISLEVGTSRKLENFVWRAAWRVERTGAVNMVGPRRSAKENETFSILGRTSSESDSELDSLSKRVGNDRTIAAFGISSPKIVMTRLDPLSRWRISSTMQ